MKISNERKNARERMARGVWGTVVFTNSRYCHHGFSSGNTHTVYLARDGATLFARSWATRKPFPLRGFEDRELRNLVKKQ